MRKILFVTGCVIAAFMAEFVIVNIWGARWLPALDLLFIVFFNLAFGIRYSLFAAVLAGILHEGLGGQTFGIYLLSFVTCAYLTTVIKPYIYQPGSVVARLTLMASIVAINFFIHLCLSLKEVQLNVPDAFHFIFFPQMAVTLVAALFIFPYMRQCVLKYFV